MKKLLFLLLVSAAFTSCKVSFVPTKSPSAIANVLDIQNSTDGLYDGIINGDKGYAAHAPEYTLIGSKIDSVVAFNQTRIKGANIYRQSVLLQSAFKKYTSEHSAKSVISAGEARVYKAYIKSFIKPILVSELSLK
jgi:hypothetical protein